MQLVVDANPLISILIRAGKPIRVLFSDEIKLFAPALLFEEINRNKSEIIRKSGLTKREFEDFFLILKNRIRIIPEKSFLKYMSQAKKICPDEKDMIYFALALYLKCGIWSNEKKLKQQNKVAVHSTHDLIRLFKL